jgi:hypothetical protein
VITSDLNVIPFLKVMTKRQRWSKVKEAVLAGMTMKEASEAFNVKVSTVCMRAKREGWGVKELRAGRNDVLVATIEAKAAEISPGVTEHRLNMLATSMASRRALATAIQKGMAHLSRLSEEELVKQHKALASFSAAAEALFWVEGAGDRRRRSGSQDGAGGEWAKRHEGGEFAIDPNKSRAVEAGDVGEKGERGSNGGRASCGRCGFEGCCSGSGS